MVDPYTEYFLNVDYYQVENYPYMQTNTIFISPERLDYMDVTFLFSDKTDNYARVVKGGITALSELQKGIKFFLEQIKNDELSVASAEVSVVVFDNYASISRK